jgi:hypothetical protein
MKMAIPFERSHKAKTFLIMNGSSIEKDKVEILAFFSLAMDHLNIGDEVSRSLKKKLSGIFENDTVTCFLLGQLARNDEYPDGIDGKEILDHAINILSGAQRLIGGRFVRVDCKDVKGLLRFYQENGFSILPESFEF